eukprot:4465047-Prymnesium_polylepis.1
MLRVESAHGRALEGEAVPVEAFAADDLGLLRAQLELHLANAPNRAAEVDLSVGVGVDHVGREAVLRLLEDEAVLVVD